MAAPNSFGQLVVAATTNQRTYTFWKNGLALTGTISGHWGSLWKVPGNPRAGANPGAVMNPDNTTEGSLKQADATGGRKLYLLSASSGSGSIIGCLIPYDRLLTISGLSGTNTGAQTVGGSLTRHTDGLGNEIWVEIYTQIGTTNRTITASYTNESGTSGRTTQAVSFGGASAAQERNPTNMCRLPLQSGDVGVQAVASVTLSGSTGTAGDFGVTIAHPYCVVPSIRGITQWDTEFQLGGPPEVKAGACVALMHSGSIQNTFMFGQIRMVEY